MPNTYLRLTEGQSRAVRASYARLLIFSRARREFIRHCRATGWGAEHVSELWAAHCARLGASS